MEENRQAVAAVVKCDTHLAYRVEHRLTEDVVWSDDLPADAETALRAYIEAEDPDLIGLLHFERARDYSDEVEFVGQFADGSVHGVVTVVGLGEPVRWAVTHAAVCTLEELPEAEEDEDE